MKCSKCGEEITGALYLSEDREPLCFKCVSNMNRCSCGVYVDGGCVCKKCVERSFTNIINPYSTKIKHIFKNKENIDKCLNKRYYGLELEYNNAQPELFYYKNKDLYKDKLIYNKSDSSIGRGFELNIIPSDYSSIKQIINRLDLLSLVKRGTPQELYENAGVHIHVSSNCVSKEDAFKLNLLFNNRINSKFKNYVYYLSGRTNRLGAVCRDGYYKIGNIRYKTEMGTDHNCAINFNNLSTVEFRLFGSTVLKEKLLGYIEFVNLALEFVNKNSLEKMKITNFLLYVKKNAKNPYNKTRIRNIEKKGLILDKYEKINFSYNKLIELLKTSNKSNITKLLCQLSKIPLENIDDRLTINNIEDYGEAGYQNSFEIVLRKRIIDIILNKEVKECV